MKTKTPKEGPWLSWFAIIKWEDGGDPIIVPVPKIRNFSPSNLTDFGRTQWYRVKGAAKYWNDGKEHSALALISCLGG